MPLSWGGNYINYNQNQARLIYPTLGCGPFARRDHAFILSLRGLGMKTRAFLPRGYFFKLIL